MQNPGDFDLQTFVESLTPGQFSITGVQEEGIPLPEHPTNGFTTKVTIELTVPPTEGGSTTTIADLTEPMTELLGTTPVTSTIINF
jgi:hypothetical protein